MRTDLPFSSPDGPRPARSPFIPFIVAPCRDWVEYVAIEDHVLWVETHWSDAGTLPCRGEALACVGCVGKMPLRCRGYLAAMEPHFKRVVICEITEEGALNCDWPLERTGPNLRGQTFRLSRIKPGKRARMVISFAHTRLLANHEALPRLNVLKHLCSVWQIPYDG